MSLRRAVRLVVDGTPRAIHLCNVYTLSLGASDDALVEMLNRGDLNLPDGMPLVWIARMLGVPKPERVYGPDLMRGALAAGGATARHYFFGSTASTCEMLQEAIKENWPDARLVGFEAPPFTELSSDFLDEAAIRMTEADATVVWVGMGTPKQDWLVDQLSERVGITFVAIGAAFDFLAGTKRQAPVWMQRSGFEWLFRLLTEPRRLWKRYLVGNVEFVRDCLRNRPQLAPSSARP